MSALLDKDPNHRSIAFLDKYAQERWDTVLHYMVSLKTKSVMNKHEMNDLLKNEFLGIQSNLIKANTHGNPALWLL